MRLLSFSYRSQIDYGTNNILTNIMNRLSIKVKAKVNYLKIV
jgi:hypothetical protein